MLYRQELSVLEYEMTKKSFVTLTRSHYLQVSFSVTAVVLQAAGTV